jgi:transcriptional regulator with XRE-family HTH domain
MLNVNEVPTSTEVVLLREKQGKYSSGIVSLPFPAVSLVIGTSEESYLLSGPARVSVPDMFAYESLAKATGAELRECSTSFLQIVAYSIASDIVLTSYQTVHLLPDEASLPMPIRQSKSEVSAQVSSQSMQVRRLREISGLTVEHLASIFGVSRITYHKWMDGSPLSDRHREHLLEVLPLVEEALQRLGNTNAVSTWLLTPVSPGGKKPIEYLSTRQYTIFRGFLLRTRTGQETFRPLTPSKFVYLERPREDIEDELERLNPSFRLNEDDTDASDISQ